MKQTKAKSSELIQGLNALFRKLIESIKYTVLGNIQVKLLLYSDLCGFRCFFFKLWTKIKMLTSGQISVQQLLGDIFAQIKLSVQNLIAQAMIGMNLPVKNN